MANMRGGKFILRDNLRGLTRSTPPLKALGATRILIARAFAM